MVSPGGVAVQNVSNYHLMMEPGRGKAERTRERVQWVAMDLYLQQGFHETTVKQIAAAAGITEMTFFRHFPTKESVVLDDPFDPAIAAAVTAQPVELRPVERVCRGFVDAIAALDLPVSDEVRRRLQVAARTPALRAGQWRNLEATKVVVSQALQADGVSKGDADISAAVCLAALMEALLASGAQETNGPPEPLASVLLPALELVVPGCCDRASVPQPARDES